MDFQKSRYENLDHALCLAFCNNLFYLRKSHGRGSFEIRRQVDKGKPVKLILKKYGRFWSRFFRLGSDPVAGSCNHGKKGRFTQNLGNVVTTLTDSGLPKEDSPYYFTVFNPNQLQVSVVVFVFRITATNRDWQGGQDICTFKMCKISEGAFFQKAPCFTEILMQPSIYKIIRERK